MLASQPFVQRLTVPAPVVRRRGSAGSPVSTLGLARHTQNRDDGRLLGSMYRWVSFNAHLLAP